MTDRRIHFFIFDDLNRFVGRFSLVPKGARNSADSNKEAGECKEILPYSDVKLCIDGYCLSNFHNTLNTSPKYRKLVMKSLFDSTNNISADRDVDVNLQLVRPKADILDYEWNYRIFKMIIEKQELEYSMSWLSTLGGAFSALGDDFEHCAKVAGKISIRQLEIALRLAEPPLVARCKLYMSLSLIQQKKLSLAKKMIEEQYEVAKAYKDFRLINMCKGIWSKLQYTYKLQKLNNRISC